MTKKELRTIIKTQEKQLTEEMLAISSKQIIDQLIRTIDFEKYAEFFFYYPLKKEISLLPLAAQVLSIRKKIYFPRVDQDEMEFFRVSDLNQDFLKGSYGVMEPVGGEKPSFENAICFVPGFAFDRAGYRLGHGAGYYDRYLGAHPEVEMVGICSNRFFVPDIPTEAFDIPMQRIVTETTVYDVFSHQK